MNSKMYYGGSQSKQASPEQLQDNYSSDSSTIGRFQGKPKRVQWLFYAFILGFIVVTITVFYQQVIYGPEGAKAAKESRLDEVEIPAHRGTIFDAHETVLSSSVDRYVVAIDQIVAKDWQAIDCNGKNDSYCHQVDGHPVGANGVIGLSRLLSKALERTPQSIAYDLLGDSRYKIIARDVTPQKQREIEALHIVGLMQMKATSTRVYPQGNVAGSEIGTATTAPDGQIQAQSGIELMMNQELAGTPGIKRFEKGGAGERIPVVNVDETPEVDGLDVKSTIDVDIQWKLQQLIDAEQQKNKSEWGIGVVERVKTGEIVAAASDREPNAGSQDATNASRCFGTAFEPGSTVKTLTVSGLMTAGLAEPETRYSVPNRYTNEFGQEIKDWEEHGTMTLTLAGIVGNSFNTGTVIASRPWPVDQRVAMYEKYGIGNLTGVDFPGEASGTLWDAASLDGRSRDTIVFGQGLSTTALQMVNAYATIANWGKNPVPTLIAATRSGDSPWQPYPKSKEGEQVISEEVAMKTMGILEACVASSNCRYMGIPEYRIGGKTGTAEMWDGDHWVLVHSFIGVFPMDDPQYVAGLFFKGGTNTQTTLVAGPFFKDIANFIIQKEGIAPSGPVGYLPPIR